MTYPFVAAKYFTANGMREPRAVVIHMAEGGGTVAWLTHPTNDNSSHFVVEYSGRIVQMVKDADASHSLHVSFDADTNDAPDFGIYSAEIGKSVLGDGWADPNRYIFAVEIEGYAAAGPNAAQVTALGALISDLRARHPSIRGLLGHRDFQDYKACPGGQVPWGVLGGHGLQGDDMTITTIKGEDWTPTSGAAGASNGVLREQPITTAPIVARIPAGATVRSIAEIATSAATDSNWRLTEHLGRPMFMLRRDWGAVVQGGSPAVDQALADYIARKPAIDCTPLVNAARNEGVTAGLRDGARAVRDAAVNEAAKYGG